jgi:hypothetical protein
MAIKYTYVHNGHKIGIPTFSISKPSKIYPNWDFWFANIQTIWQPCYVDWSNLSIIGEITTQRCNQSLGSPWIRRQVLEANVFRTSYKLQRLPRIRSCFWLCFIVKSTSIITHKYFYLDKKYSNVHILSEGWLTAVSCIARTKVFFSNCFWTTLSSSQHCHLPS